MSFPVLEFPPRVLGMLGKHSTTEYHPQPPKSLIFHFSSLPTSPPLLFVCVCVSVFEHVPISLYRSLNRTSGNSRSPVLFLSAIFSWDRGLSLNLELGLWLANPAVFLSPVYTALGLWVYAASLAFPWLLGMSTQVILFAYWSISPCPSLSFKCDVSTC